MKLSSKIFVVGKIIYLVALEKVNRAAKRVFRPFIIKKLIRQNIESNQSCIFPGGPVVSMTTHSRRISDVYLSIESIAAGDLLPSRLVLWVDSELLTQGLPPALQRLSDRGLEIRSTIDYGPHTKYFPQVLSDASSEIPLVTADDDQLYPKYWLHLLFESSKREPDVIHCFRAHVITFDLVGNLLPYLSWRRCLSNKPSYANFLTGVGGVIYPKKMQVALARYGTAFLAKCPRADDIWLNFVALKEGVKVRQIAPYPSRFYEIPGSRNGALAQVNNSGGGNDSQLAATYTLQDLKFLRDYLKK